MLPDAVPEEEFIWAELTVVAVRLVVAGVLWWLALLMLDHPTESASNAYVINLRMTLWLFFVEVLIGLYSVRYGAMDSYPIAKRTAFVLAECWAQAWQMAIYASLNILLRYILVTVFTGCALSFFGNGFVTRLVPFLMTAGFYIACLYRFSSMAGPPVIRGTHIGSYREAVYRAAKIIQKLQLSVFEEARNNGSLIDHPGKLDLLRSSFGGVFLPASSLEPHFLLLGTTSSGKTLSVRMLLRSALAASGELKSRALIYDGKREYYPLLLGMGIPPEKLLIMNPADERCVAWAIAKDIRNRDDAVNLTAILVPDRKDANDNQFFIQALRSLIAAVMMALHSISPETWTLFDVVFAMGTPARMKRLLKTTSEGREIISRYFTDAKETVGGLISTIDARFINEYKTLALVWRSCERSISMTEWIKGKSILLMGFDANNQAVDRVNQAIFQRAAQLLCSLPEASDSDYPETWVVLDEVRFTGRLPMLSELMSFGRTKRVRVVLAPQDVDGLMDVYGEHRTQEMLGLCGNVGILRLSSTKTRDWAAKFFGDYDSWETETSESFSTSSGASGNVSTTSSSRTTGSTTRRVKRESILPSEFLNLPQTNRENGMHGFFATPILGAWRAQIPPQFIDENIGSRDPEAHAFIPRASFRVNQVKWSEEEEEKFSAKRSGSLTPDLYSDGSADVETNTKNSPIRPDEEKGDAENSNSGHSPLPDW